MKPKLSFPAGRANENSVLRPPSVRLYARVKTFQKYFPRARRRTNEKKLYAGPPARHARAPRAGAIRVLRPSERPTREMKKKNVIEA